MNKTDSTQEPDVEEILERFEFDTRAYAVDGGDNAEQRAKNRAEAKQALNQLILKARKEGQAVGQYQAADRLYGHVTNMWLFRDDKRPKLKENVEQHANDMLKDCENLMNANAKEYRLYIKALKRTSGGGDE